MCVLTGCLPASWMTPPPKETAPQIHHDSGAVKDHVVVVRESGKITDPVNVLVVTAPRLAEATEVIGIIDIHVVVGDHDAAIAALRKRAAELGADAVVGVQFHHGHDETGPLHLSGLAVRLLGGL
ncbi:hypothetical protein JYT28_00090 [Desulfobulbus sp. AH-315-M07]|nr:hypothetical protein [Desulfobulbus sp. AH-315-M07]